MKPLLKCAQSLNNQTNQLVTAIICKDRILDKAIKSGFLEISLFKRHSTGANPIANFIGEKSGLSRQAKLGRGGSQNELTKPLEKNPVGVSPTWSKPQLAGQ
jgi:hypothetical protein